jgi:TonB family protein
MKISTHSFNAFVAALAAIVILPSISLGAQDTSSAPYQAPRALAQAKPDYSYALRHDEIEGRVVVSFTVTPSGSVTGAAIVSSTQKRLEKPAMDAIKNWRFAPGTKDGVPVNSKVIQPIAFAMAE